MEIRFVATAGIVLQALSRGLYRDSRQGVVELIVNGLDSANRMGRLPEVQVQFWKKGKHPLSQSGPCLTILDNGEGFTEEVVRNYARIAESAQIGHGRAGVGKFAPFVLTSNNGFYIISATGKKSAAFMYNLSFNEKEAIPEAFGREFLTSRDELPGLPSHGTFSMIVIPNFNEEFTQGELMKYLTIHMPNTPWNVTVDGQVVTHRVFPIARRITVPSPSGIEGDVLIELGKSSATTDSDTVWLYDANTQRPVVDLRLVLVGQLDLVLRDPRLVGAIYVPKLEDRTAANRSGLVTNFWKSKMGVSLYDIIQHVVAQAARELLGEEKHATTTEQLSLEEAQALFRKAFGDPKPLPAEEAGSGSNRPSGGSSGGGDGNRPPRKPGSSKTRASKYMGPQGVKIEDMDYQVYTFVIPNVAGEVVMPSEVRNGNAMVVNMGHPDVIQAKAGGNRQASLLRHIMRAMIEAHVQYTHAGQSWHRKLHELLAKVENR